MECTYCNVELIHEDVYGKYLNDPQYCEIHGQIYRCPNANGFDTKEEVDEYLQTTEQTLKDFDCDSWEELVCDSATHHVEGSFYTDRQDNLYEGYPC